MMEQWHPLGPVGVITAFNFPVAVWAWNAALAAVCGDPVVWKPCRADAAHRRSRCSTSPIACMADHGVAGVFNLVVGPGRTVGERMLHDRRAAADLVHRLDRASAAASREVVAGRFGRTILELGGNNAIVVAEDARPRSRASRAILFGAVGTAGQRCTIDAAAHRAPIASPTTLVERLVDGLRAGADRRSARRRRR